MHVLKAIFFYRNRPKISYCCKKVEKLSGIVGCAPRPPVAGGSAPIPHTDSPPISDFGYAPGCQY